MDHQNRVKAEESVPKEPNGTPKPGKGKKSVPKEH
jgi:hypothetical protein